MLAGASALLDAAARCESEGRLDAELALLDRLGAELRLRRGQLAARAWRLHDAAQAFREVIALDPGNAEAELELAVLTRLLGHDAVSLAHWRRVAALRPQLDQPWFEAARLEASEDALDVALALLGRMQGRVADGYWLAEIDRLQHWASETRQTALRVLRERSEAPVERLFLAQRLASLGRVCAATGLLEALPPDFDPVGQAVTRYRVGRRSDPDAAVAALLSWIDGRPPNSLETKDRVYLAEMLFRAGRVTDAASLIGRHTDTEAAARPLAARICFAAADFPACLKLAGQMIDADPDSTGPYQVAFGALLASGAIRPLQGTHAALPAGFGRIPAVLVQYWDQGALPPDVAAVVAGWADAPMRRIMQDRQSATDYIRQHYPARYLQAFERCHHAAMRSDFARLCVLSRDGGIYLDVDEACRDQPTDLLRTVAGHELVCTVLDQVTPYTNNALIAAMPGHPVLRACLTEAVTRLLRSEDKADIWSTTGPGLLTRNLVRHLREHGTGAGGIALLSEFGWRRLCAPRNSLAYKADASGNWRLS